MNGLLRQVRAVRTLEGGHAVYGRAKVWMRKFRPEAVYPTSLYVLRPKLRKLEAIQEMLGRKGYNIFDLNAVVTVGDITIGPPLVEWDGRCYVIVDGIHRFYLAKLQNTAVNAICVRGADRRYPVIGMPVRWGEVVVRYDLPTNPKERRRLRAGLKDTSESLRECYRDLSFLGSGGRRPSGSQRN